MSPAGPAGVSVRRPLGSEMVEAAAEVEARRRSVWARRRVGRCLPSLAAGAAMAAAAAVVVVREDHPPGDRQRRVPVRQVPRARSVVVAGVLQVSEPGGWRAELPRRPAVAEVVPMSTREPAVAAAVVKVAVSAVGHVDRAVEVVGAVEAVVEDRPIH